MVHLTYALGDVHGSYHLLRRAIDAIHRHARSRQHQVILIGDYIDRGEDAREVLEFLVSYQTAPLLCLKGNHEQMLTDCVVSKCALQLRAWLQHGGGRTLASYGISVDDPDALAKLPRQHIHWMRCRPAKIEGPHHVFVHAGIVPKLELSEQDEEDFLWIREPFLRARPNEFKDARHIIHGHTPVWRGKPEAGIPELLPHRTNLDTGAYMTGVLTAGVFVSDQRGGAVDLLSIV